MPERCGDDYRPRPRTVYLTMLEWFEHSMLAALEDVVAELKAFRGDTDAESWARRRLNELR